MVDTKHGLIQGCIHKHHRFKTNGNDGKSKAHCEHEELEVSHERFVNRPPFEDLRKPGRSPVDERQNHENGREKHHVDDDFSEESFVQGDRCEIALLILGIGLPLFHGRSKEEKSQQGNGGSDQRKTPQSDLLVAHKAVHSC